MLESVTLWAKLLASTATFVAAAVAIFTLLEMRRQRAAAQRPELAVSETDISIYNSADEEEYPAIWSRDGSDGILRDRKHHLKVDCYNLGVGSAKSVEGRWRFDIEDFLACIRRHDKEDLFTLATGESPIDPGGATIQITSENTYFNKVLAFFGQRSFRFPYMLPVSAYEEPYQIVVPPAYLELYAIYLWLSVRRQEFDFEPEVHRGIITEGEPPPLLLDLSYCDVEGNEYEKTFALKVESPAVGGEDDQKPGGNVLHGQMRAKEVD